eukprot:m.1226847 g.1226847  ORF g.1226847 m.1226847 type:complete len:575 (-) comp24640_c0_seq6:2419-4143(-)
MVWERNDAVFASQSSRFGVPESVIETIVLAMMWGGEKGFGVSAAPKHIDFVIRQTLENIHPAGGFGKEILCNSQKLLAPTTLAICSATERLCLWFRAHEVSDGAQLANYFETAFSYFVEYWKGKHADEVEHQLSSTYSSKITVSRAPKSKHRVQTGRMRRAAVPIPSKASAPTTAVPIVSGAPPVPAQQLSSQGARPRASAQGDGTSAKAQNLRKGETIKNVGYPTGKNAGDTTGGDDGVKPQHDTSSSRPRQGPKLATSLSVDYGGLTPTPRPHTPGKRLEVAPVQRARAADAGVRGMKQWITLAVGRCFDGGQEQQRVGESAEQAAAGSTRRAQHERPSSGGDVGGPHVSNSTIVAPGPTTALSTAAALPTIALLTQDDAEETSWWTRRYDDPAEDSDFTPEHSDNDPPSDVEDAGAAVGGDDEDAPDRVAAAGGKDSARGAALLRQKRNKPANPSARNPQSTVKRDGSSSKSSATTQRRAREHATSEENSAEDSEGTSDSDGSDDSDDSDGSDDASTSSSAEESAEESTPYRAPVPPARQRQGGVDRRVGVGGRGRRSQRRRVVHASGSGH